MKTNYEALRLFTVNIQRVNALQFNARCDLFIRTFGEERGIEYAERFAKYGMWFTIDQLQTGDDAKFYDMVLSLPMATA